MHRRSTKMILMVSVILVLGIRCSHGLQLELENKTYQDDLNDVAFSDGRFVAVGARGIVLESSDGRTWHHRDIPQPINLQAITYGNGIHVAVGSNGKVWWSNDLHLWNSTETPGQNDLNDVIWDGSGFVAVGSSGEIAVSDDGDTWVTEASGTSATLSSIAFSGQFYVAGGSHSTIVHKTVGSGWTTSVTGIGDVGEFTDVIWDGNRFSAISLFSIFFSTNPFFWTEGTLPSTGYFIEVDWTGSNYILLSNHGRIYTSPDANVWTSAPRLVYQSFRGVGSNGATSVVVGSSGVILSNEDPVGWVVQSTAAADIDGIASNGDLICALENIGSDFGHVLSSMDGIRWSRTLFTEYEGVETLDWTGDRFVGVQGQDLYWSNDCESWTIDRPPCGGNVLHDAIGVNGELSVVGSYGLVCYNVGANWYQADTPTTGTLIDIEHNSTVQVAVGEAIIVSPNREDWVDVTPDLEGPFHSVATDGQSFVAVSWSDIAHSPDGYYWSSVTPTGFSGGLTDIAYFSGQYLAFASESHWVSPDGQNWIQESWGLPENWNFRLTDAVESHGQFRVVGDNGNILRFGPVFIDDFESGDTSAWSNSG